MGNRMRGIVGVLVGLMPALLAGVAAAGTTTIDFETPDVGATPQVLLQYDAGGVTFTNHPVFCPTFTGPMGLGEVAVCDGDSSSSQMLFHRRSTRTYVAGFFRADFAGVGPVTFVQVDVQSEAVAILGVSLNLFNEAGVSVRHADPFMLDPIPCGGESYEFARVHLMSSASEPVAYAIIRPGIVPDCQCGSGCGCCEASLAIDNFTFGDCLDGAAPTLSVSLSPVVLWPPNHRLVDVHAMVEVEDDCDEAPAVRLLSITSDEPDESTSAEDQPGDIQDADLGAADVDLTLRAERAEEGEGRTYTVCYEARDGSGNATQACATVNVPHDQRN